MRKSEILHQFPKRLAFWLRDYKLNFTETGSDTLTEFQIRDSSGKPAYSVRIYPEECMAFFEDQEGNVISLFSSDKRRIRKADIYSAAVSIAVYTSVRNKGWKIGPGVILDMMRYTEDDEK